MWYRIPRLQGGAETTLTAAASLSSTTHRKAWSRPPINVDFQVLMFTSSGLLVRFLKVFERSNYQSVKWVRYLTKANGSYQIVRCLFCSQYACSQTDSEVLRECVCSGWGIKKSISCIFDTVARLLISSMRFYFLARRTKPPAQYSGTAISMQLARRPINEQVSLLNQQSGRKRERTCF